MQDRPTANELIESVRGFLETDVLPELSGRKQFHTRVAINVLNILAREFEQEEEAVRAEWERLARLLGASDEPPSDFASARAVVRDLNVALSHRIREGEFDARVDEVAAALNATVLDKLRIANPAYVREHDES